MKTGNEITVHRPRFQANRPNWFHPLGNAMRMTSDAAGVHIAGPHAEITIVAVNGEIPKTTDFWVEWKVIRTQGQMSSGNRFLTSEELAAAFGLTNDSGDHGQSIIDEFGADSAEQGLYVRFGDFLNIPCPGTGMDGDPNISILITNEIRDAIRHALQRAEKWIELVAD